MNLNDEIAKVAHELYERDGRKDGLDLAHWLEAEKIVKARIAQQKKAPADIAAPKKTVAVKTEAIKAEPKKVEPKKTTRAKKTK